MSTTCDVAVVGVGAMGAAACSHLARRGASVIGVERFDIPHAMGSSGGQSRLIRLAYYEHPDYVPLLYSSYRNWDDLGERTGSQVLYRTGCLYAGPPEGHLIAGTRASVREHGVPCEEIDRAELVRRWSVFRVPESFDVLVEPEAGFVLSEKAISLFADEALAAGAVIRGRESVRSWKVEKGGVRLTTDRGEIHAGHVIFTAGAWTSRLVGDLGVELRVTRQVLGWVWPYEPELYELDRLPCWAIEPETEEVQGVYYGFPMLPAHQFGGERGLKLAHHWPGPAADPETLDRVPVPADEEDFRPALRDYLPGADGPTLSLKVCMYTVTPDDHFIVDRHPENDRVIVACGFSGHGFKFSSAIGEALADLALEGRSDLPIGFLGLDRFS